MRAFTYAAEQPWAISESALRGILEIAQRENADLEAVAAKLGRPLENTRNVYVRDGVAVIPIAGPMFRYANLFTEISGATSIQVLARDFDEALSSPAVRAIILEVNSPGGEVAGVNELSGMIFNARGRKPIMAYIGAEANSAAYWVASAADQVIAEETAILGSIGIIATIRDTRARDAKDGVVRYEIISSQSPRKDMDPATDTGRADLQKMVDGVAEVFINALARNRGTTPENILENYGGGSILNARPAVAAGMADRLGTIEGLISELSGAGQAVVKSFGAATAAKSPRGGTTMSETLEKTAEQKAAEAASPPAIDKAGIEAAAIKAERERISTILKAPEAQGREELAQSLALETDLAPEAARKILAAAPQAGKNPLAEAMALVKNPQVGADTGDADSEATEVKAILAFASNNKKGGK